MVGGAPRLLAIALAASCACHPPAQNAPPAPVAPPRPVDAGVRRSSLPPLHVSPHARVNLTVDHAEKRLLGENVLVHYCVENTSAAPITIDVGGDYRGATRSLRFKTTVTDANDAAVEDPDPVPFSMGGISYARSIAPRESWCQSLPLAGYARIDAPGTYTIRVSHDLGWAADAAPGGEANITLAMPSPGEAEAVVAAMAALPRGAGAVGGSLSRSYQDYASLRYPIYLAPLMQLALAGHELSALEGIREIPSPEATRILLSFLDHAHTEVASAAAHALAERLPDPALSGALGPRNAFFNEMNERRKYLTRVGWRPELAGDVRAAAKKLLATDEDDRLRSGAFFLETVGVEADNAMLLDAFTRAIERTATTPRETGIAPTPRGACQELGRAAEILLARGAVAVEPPRTNGEIAQWLIAVRTGARPAGWEATFGRALTHANAHIRRLALEAMPDPVPASLLKGVETQLASSDVDVQLAALRVVDRSTLTALGRGAASIIGRTQDSWTLLTAWHAASNAGARGAAVDALIGRLTEPKLSSEALGHLLDVFEQSGRSSSGAIEPKEAAALAARWRLFVATHRARIDKRETLSLDDPTVPRDLVPKGWRISRKEKPDWPPL